MSSAIGRIPRAATALVCGFVILALVGCAGERVTVCPAVGYIHTLSVELTGDASQIAEVRVCDRDGGCSYLDQGTQPVDASSFPLVTGGSPTEIPTPRGEELSLYTARGSDNSWSFQMANTPEGGIITAYFADGAIAAEAAADFDWQQVGGITECGGPAEAGPIVFALN